MARLASLTAVTILLVTGCHHAPALLTPPPQAAPEEIAARTRADSIMAAERDREDALSRAGAERWAAEEQRQARIRVALQHTLAQRIHFDFERAELRPGDLPLLERKLAILQANPTVTIRVAGNCDERGSEEYNLVLGNRRALVARQYLTSHGIAADRITTVSNGKERPLLHGSDQAGWAANRRDDFEPVHGAESLIPPMASR